MTSMRARLFLVLIVTTGNVWLSAVAWIYFSTQAQVEKVLDARLQEAARMVDSLIADRRIDVASAVKMAVDRPDSFSADVPDYERQLSCQIWSLSGVLVGRSQSAPLQALGSGGGGFQETNINGELWRVYSVIDQKLGVRVLVGDSIAVRQRLVSDVVKGLLFPVAFVLPVLALLIWLSVKRGLRPLQSLADGLSGRGASDLHPVDMRTAPSEIRPVANALNGLFQRLRESREREKNFTAFAAHELKTPLAGLKTQAQIALGADQPEMRMQALGRIIQSVDRTSRLVRQLLDLSEVEARAEEPDTRHAPLSEIISEVIESLSQVAAARHITIDVSSIGNHLIIRRDGSLLSVALRNIIENALQHAEEGTTVHCAVEQRDDAVVVHVMDSGPGLSEEMLVRVRERFYRGPQTAIRGAHGSGLGLSIVDAAIGRMGGELVLDRREDRGLDVSLSLPVGLFRDMERPKCR